MTNMVQTVREELKALVARALQEAADAGELNRPQMPDAIIETPKEKGFGDFSCNVALQAARIFGKPPRQIAEIILKRIEAMDNASALINKMECAGPGFINFYLDVYWLRSAILAAQCERGDYGRSRLGKDQKVMVEFVSANPTGPLHMGNARGGALGDCIAGVLEASGYNVTREYYINDAGNQVGRFGESLEARYIQLLKGQDAAVFPEDGYHGDDVVAHASEYIAQFGDKLLSEDPDKRKKALVDFALARNLDSIKASLLKYGIEYDVWFSEQSLYDSGEMEETLEYLNSRGCTYQAEGAVWFRATDFGADKDEVLVRSNGIPTYFASDIAYHRNKFVKREFYRVINILGADHHGHSKRFKAAVTVLGVEPERFDIVIFQLVRLYRNGEIARMSKRTGRSISLDDLLEDVGRDAARFFFNMKSAGSHLDFDMDLAVRQSNENPVFYVQYAHARICSMKKVLAAEGVEIPAADQVDLNLLASPEELNLMRRIAEYPEEMALASQMLEPARLTRYALDLASDFHSFYNSCRVKGEASDLMNARIILVDSVHIVLSNLLGVLKISAPESM